MDELFQRYTHAFDAMDASAIAQLYTLPCATSDGDGSRVFNDRDSLESKFTVNCKDMQAMGYQYAEFSVLNVIALGDSAKAAQLGWRVHLDGSQVEFRCLYLCHLVSTDWLIFSAHVYEGEFTGVI